MLLDENSIIPLYHQLAEEIKNNIDSGVWGPHSIIPSESELCKKYSVSRGTVRQALSQLVQHGFLNRKQGKGTFVSEPKTTERLNIFHSTDQDITGKGIKPFSKILQNEIIEPNPSITNILKLKTGEKVYKIIGVKIYESIPMTLETTYLTERFFPDLDKIEKNKLETVPLYDIMSEMYHLKITGLEETFEPTRVDEFEALKLKVPMNTITLIINRITYTTENVPFEYRKILVSSENCKYMVKFNAEHGTMDLQI